MRKATPWLGEAERESEREGGEKDICGMAFRGKNIFLLLKWVLVQS